MKNGLKIGFFLCFLCSHSVLKAQDSYVQEVQNIHEEINLLRFEEQDVIQYLSKHNDLVSDLLSYLRRMSLYSSIGSVVISSEYKDWLHLSLALKNQAPEIVKHYSHILQHIQSLVYIRSQRILKENQLRYLLQQLDHERQEAHENE